MQVGPDPDHLCDVAGSVAWCLIPGYLPKPLRNLSSTCRRDCEAPAFQRVPKVIAYTRPEKKKKQLRGGAGAAGFCPAPVVTLPGSADRAQRNETSCSPSKPRCWVCGGGVQKSSASTPCEKEQPPPAPYRDWSQLTRPLKGKEESYLREAAVTAQRFSSAPGAGCQPAFSRPPRSHRRSSLCRRRVAVLSLSASPRETPGLVFVGSPAQPPPPAPRCFSSRAQA